MEARLFAYFIFGCHVRSQEGNESTTTPSVSALMHSSSGIAYRQSHCPCGDIKGNFKGRYKLRKGVFRINKSGSPTPLNPTKQAREETEPE
jgi:hypothetical protein